MPRMKPHNATGLEEGVGKVNFVKCRPSVIRLMNVLIAGVFLWAILLCICMARCREKDSLHSPGQLLEFENVGSLGSTTYMDRLLKAKIRAGSCQIVGKDVPAKSYIIEEAFPAEQQRRTNCGWQEDTLSKQSPMVRASYKDWLEVRARRRHCKHTAPYAHRVLHEQRPAVVEKGAAEYA